MDIWRILGIEKTKDKNAIKKAYREKLVLVNPEDDQEGFMALRQSYEDAIAYADKPDEAEEEEELSEIQRKLLEIYNDFNKRIEPEEWSVIFSGDEFVALDTCEESRNEVLVFLMTHSYVPHKVFKFIVETFRLEDIKEELRETFPEDFIEFVIDNGRYDDRLDYYKFEEVGDDVDEFIRLHNRLRSLRAENYVEAEAKLIDEIDSLDCKHPYMDMAKLSHEIHKINEQISPEGGVEERALRFSTELEALQKKADELLTRYPEDDFLLICAGDYAYARLRYEEALGYFERAKEYALDTYIAKSRIARVYCDLERYEEAKDIYMELLDINPYDDSSHMGLKSCSENIAKQLEKSIEDNPEDNKSKLKLGWCYYRNNEFEKAKELLSSFEPDDEDKLEYNNLFGRQYLYTGDYNTALEKFFICKELIEAIPEDDKSEKAVKDRSKAEYVNYFIGTCYCKQDKYEEAREYLLDAKASSNELVNAIHDELCQIEYKCGNYEECIRVAEEFLDKKESYDTYLYMAKSLYALREYSSAINACEHAIAMYPYAPEPYDVMLDIYWDHDMLEDMKHIIERYDSTGAKGVSIELHRARLARCDKKYEEALEILNIVDEHIDEAGCTKDFVADFYDSYAITYLYLDRDEEAVKYMEQELQIEPKRCFAIERLAGVYHTNRNFEKALEWYKKLLSLTEDEGYKNKAYCGMAAAYSCMQDFENAKKTFEECEADIGYEDFYVIDHAELLARMNDLDGAKALIDKCVEIVEDRTIVQYCYGNLCCFLGNAGMLEEAYEYYKKGVEFNPEDAMIYRSMGQIYYDHGMYDKAIELLKKAYEVDTENEKYVCGPYLMAVSMVDDVTKPEYKEYIEVGLSQVENANTAYKLNRKTEVYLGLGEYDKALETAEEALAMKVIKYDCFHERHATWCLKGLIYREMGEYEKAIDAFERALSIFGYYPLYEEYIAEVKRMMEEVN